MVRKSYIYSSKLLMTALLLPLLTTACMSGLDDGLAEASDRADPLDANGLDGRGEDPAKAPVATKPADTKIPPAKPAVPVFGDGDDSNFDPDDSEIECGDGSVQGTEECDDENEISGDGCSAACITECGDGVRDVDNSDDEAYLEECDDGGVVDGDGCSSECESEAVVVDSARITFDVGYSHVCYVDPVTLQLKCWGLNTDGQLGQGSTASIGNGVGATVTDTDPVDIGTGLSTELIVAGGDSANGHTCVVTNTNSVKCWGQNAAGQLGKGNTTDLGDGTGEMGDALLDISLGTGLGAVDIDAGASHTCALLDDDSIKCFGLNADGQLGQGSVLSRGDGAGEMGASLAAVSLGAGRTGELVVTGGHHTCALLDNASVKCWGQGDFGQLGQDATANIGDGVGTSVSATTAIVLGTTAIDLAAGLSHSCALLTGGTVKCWGLNASGQLGQGTVINIGDDGTPTVAATAAINLGAGRTATQIAAGDLFTCALLDNAGVKCWGENAQGQLGQGDTTDRGNGVGASVSATPVINLGTGRTAVAIAAGGATACALLDNDEIKCWGANTAGQLGQDSVLTLGDGASEMGDDLDPIVTGF